MILRGIDMKLWLAEQSLRGTVGKRYGDIGALWADGLPGFGETISIAAKYTRDLTIIDPAAGCWPPVQQKLAQWGITCDYIPIDVLQYDGLPFQLAQCAGLLYHFPDPRQLWAKLTEIITERLVVHTVTVPHWILPEGRIQLTKCDPALRMKIEHFWNRGLSPRWIRPESEIGQSLPYAAMHTVYSAEQLRRDALDFGWTPIFDAQWSQGLNAALICEKQ